jgi:hypothetical protein
LLSAEALRLSAFCTHEATSYLLVCH